MKCLNLTVVIACCCLHGQASALECYQQSAALQELGDSYYELEGSLSGQDPAYQQALQQVAAIEGDWHGTLEELECSGPDRAPREKLRSAEALVTINSDAAAPYRLFLEKTYPQVQYTRREVLDLLISDRVFDVEAGQAGFLATVRQRRKVLRPAQGESDKAPERTFSRLVETVTLTQYQNGRLMIESSQYSNGILVYRMTLSLRR